MLSNDEILYLDPFKEPPGTLHPFALFKLKCVLAQDHMAWETQGPIADRTNERLATSDRGIAMLRQMLKREIEKVQMGLDPMNVYRDPDHTIVDTKLQESINDLGRWRGAAPPPPEFARTTSNRGDY
jgi:hypothetical protein